MCGKIDKNLSIIVISGVTYNVGHTGGHYGGYTPVGKLQFEKNSI